MMNRHFNCGLTIIIALLLVLLFIHGHSQSTGRTQMKRVDIVNDKHWCIMPIETALFMTDYGAADYQKLGRN